MESVSNLYIIITHFHSDYVGSLGSLLFYTDKLGIENVNIIYPDLINLKKLINIYGVERTNIKLITPIEVEDFTITEYEQRHSFFEYYGYLIELEKAKIYYSGDTKIIPNEILLKLKAKEIDFFYQDVRIDINDYHISLEELAEIIPPEFRKILRVCTCQMKKIRKKLKKKGLV